MVTFADVTVAGSMSSLMVKMTFEFGATLEPAAGDAVITVGAVVSALVVYEKT